MPQDSEMVRQDSWGDLKKPQDPGQPTSASAPPKFPQALSQNETQLIPEAEPWKKIFQMDNPENSFNCYLNVVVQTLWRT